MSRSIDRAAAALFFTLTASSGANAAGVRPDATVTCNIPQPCALYQNANGIGLSATSAKSEGIYGATTFPATAVSNRTFGVKGVDASTNKNEYNAGLYGASPDGFGLYATSPSGTAVYATSTSGVGVRAASTSGIAVLAATTSGTAVNAIATSGIALNAASTSGYAVNASSSYVAMNATSSNDVALFATTFAPNENGGDGVQGIDGSTNGGVNVGVLGYTNNGAYGVEGFSNTDGLGGVGGYITSAADPTSGIGVSGAGHVGLYGSSDYYPLELRNAIGIDGLTVVSTGDVYTEGTYNTFVHTRNGDAIAFTKRSTKSNLEDSGTAELTDGIATVHFDPTFAAAIDVRGVYQVFLTPAGDTRGLYVARKTRAGFVVRETQGGRGNLSFDYRILATALGHGDDRMALVPATLVHKLRALPSTRALWMPNPSPVYHEARRE